MMLAARILSFWAGWKAGMLGPASSDTGRRSKQVFGEKT